jgi:hypothetical protein
MHAPHEDRSVRGGPSTRRAFLRAAANALAMAAIAGRTASRAHADQDFHYFRVGRHRGRWLFSTPDDRPFFSIALNHIDPTPLQGPGDIDRWRSKYGNSMERWLREAVAVDLADWGFNSVGWVQEWVTTAMRHSRNFTFEEYQWLGLPYCHRLPFAEFHQWDGWSRHPDILGSDFEDWCEHVARSECSRMASDPKLIGYFYVDCPTWTHVRPPNAWKGPLFDPERLASEAGRRELRALAGRYYRVTHDAIRRYDKNHLILGDRYEAAAPLAVEVVEAALPYIDVLCFQDFKAPEQVATDLTRFHRQYAKPVLLADSCVGRTLPDGSKQHVPEGYVRLLEAARGVEGCVGLHLCGAYLKNRRRRRGLRDEDEMPDAPAIAAIRQANRETARWMATFEDPASPSGAAP